MKVVVIGGGFVGLVSAAFFASLNCDVIVVDKSQERVAQINLKSAPFFEQGLDDLLEKYVGKNLHASADLRLAMTDADVIFICVGTPVSEAGSIDLSHIKEVSWQLGSGLKGLSKNVTIVVKSTVVPGTTQDVVKSIVFSQLEEPAKNYVHVAMNPEFLREGSAVKDTFNQDRIIIGFESEVAKQSLLNLYSGIADSVPRITTSIKTAELCKYASNSFFATLISFSNEIAKLCELNDEIDVRTVFDSLFQDKRFKPEQNESDLPSLTSYLWPGLGYGGSCFPKDIAALNHYAKQNNVANPLLFGVQYTNETQTQRLVEKYIDQGKRPRVGIWGLSFKPDTDDIRDSKSLEIIEIALGYGLKVVAFDPLVKTLKDWPEVEIKGSMENVLDDSDVLFVATASSCFVDQDAAVLLSRFSGDVVDARLALDTKLLSNRRVFGPGLA